MRTHWSIYVMLALAVAFLIASWLASPSEGHPHGWESFRETHRIARAVRVERPGFTPRHSLRWSRMIRDVAEKHDLDPLLIVAMAGQESSYNPRTSHAGAAGVLQVTPIAHRTVSRHPYRSNRYNTDDAYALRQGVRYLRYCMEWCGAYALRCWYAGGPSPAGAWYEHQIAERIEWLRTRLRGTRRVVRR